MADHSAFFYGTLPCPIPIGNSHIKLNILSSRNLSTVDS